MSTHDPLDPAPASGAAAAAVHRRLSRALADLGIAPQPIGPHIQNWTTLVDGVVTFGALSITTAARLANVLEDIAVSRVCAPHVNRNDDDDSDQATSSDFAQTFEPVAPPFESGSGPSRFHPRVAN